MTFAKRLQVWFVVTLALTVGAFVYFRVGLPFIDWASQPQYQGPFSPVLGPAETLPPVAMLILELGTTIWLIYGGTQSERKQRAIVSRGRR
ncbi:hypothetical protein [Halomarina oriensis]|uniref:Uncharacterized protein n=1 Tax=Halomarina oriensis TaxID=671145 RepID=A0A6B0GVZ0_9EURY|nr:hypothetical protein [Halomarina oriensis]MWG35898.1 hypothetical protein [Halomarina oriensis]